MSEKRQKIQLELAFATEGKGEAPRPRCRRDRDVRGGVRARKPGVHRAADGGGL